MIKRDLHNCTLYEYDDHVSLAIREQVLITLHESFPTSKLFARKGWYYYIGVYKSEYDDDDGLINVVVHKLLDCIERIKHKD